MATTKTSVVVGLRSVLREGNLVMAVFGPDDWKKPALALTERAGRARTFTATSLRWRRSRPALAD